MLAVSATEMSHALSAVERAAVPPAAASGSSQPPTLGDTFEPVLGVPAGGGSAVGSVVMLGASPLEGEGEVWAYGTVGDVPANVGGKSYANQYVLLEHSGSQDWQIVPLPPGPGGKPLSGYSSGSDTTYPATLGPLGGRVTADGGVVLLTEGGIVTRDPKDEPKLAPVPEGKLLGTGESLPPQQPPEGASPPYAAVEETGEGADRTGVLVVPYGSSPSAPRVLHYDGTKWGEEEVTGSDVGAESGFTPETLACGPSAGSETEGSSPTNCWLLAAYKSQSSKREPNRLALFRRTLISKPEEPSRYEWRQTALGGLLGEEPASSTTVLGPMAQTLTVTPTGVWVDFKTTPSGSGPITASEFVKSGSEGSASAKQWCYPAVASLCASLGASLPASYQSFAWSVSGEEPGKRIITGLANGAMLELSGELFSYEIGPGGRLRSVGGAAFSSPSEGWIANGFGTSSVDREGQAQLIHLTSKPQGDQLQQSPVPFRYPLLAVAQAPGSTPGDAGAQAVAVGMQGEVGRYVPGLGWRPESLFDGAGKAQTPTLRGVAWPEPGRAYAVGDEGAMWLWQASTGLWEPDPAKPLNFITNLTAIAFSPTNPYLGFAVGKGGALLRFGKSWVQEQLPPELEHVNFTSVTFAGNQALATYRDVITEPESTNGPAESGGVAVKEGERPWHVDPAAAALLAELPHAKDTVLSKVSGLSDGGAVAAGPGLVIERESESGPWHFSPQPLPEALNISALGAYRDSSGAVRAFVSIDLDEALDPNAATRLESGAWAGDVPPPGGPGVPPFLPPADPLPDSGYLLQETSSGWTDMEHMALQAGRGGDMPVRPDPVLALLVDSTGDSGLAVGGQTYDTVGANKGESTSGPEAPFETAAVLRFGPGASGATSSNATAETILPSPGVATFAVGGEAACGAACAERANEGLGPDVSLTHALQRAASIESNSGGRLREFLYTGGRFDESTPLPRENPQRLEALEAEERQLARYAGLLAGGGIPVHIAAPPTKFLGDGSLSSSLEASFPESPPNSSYYAYTSPGSSGGSVRVVVLDYSNLELGVEQQEWLRDELWEAANPANQGHPGSPIPVIVMGNAPLGFKLAGDSPPEARDAEAVAAILVEGGASAYLFDYPGANVVTTLSAGGKSIPAFGSGTFGYTRPPASFTTDSLFSSGFLILEVHSSEPVPGDAPNVVKVTAHIEPNIGELALNAVDGVLVRRSHVALFEALARRPPQGIAVSEEASGEVALLGSEPYDQIPFNCLGANCVNAVPTEYTFASSEPKIGEFVAHDPTSANPRQVLLGANQMPTPDPHSGLFCGLNAGTTTVSITAGGLTYSEPVTVQAGSVEYPCGTVKLGNSPAAEAPAKANFTVPPLSPANAPPAAVGPQLPSIPVPPAPSPIAPVVAHPVPPLASIFAPPIPSVAVPVLLPLPTLPVEPTPPGGVAQVFEPAPATKEEREEEEAYELNESSSATAYDVNQSNASGPWLIIALAVIAVGAGVALRRPPRREVALVQATPRRRRDPTRLGGAGGRNPR